MRLLVQTQWRQMKVIFQMMKQNAFSKTVNNDSTIYYLSFWDVILFILVIFWGTLKKNKKRKKQNKKKQKQIWIVTVFILKLIRDRFQLEILRLGKVLTTNNPSLIFDFCSWKSHLMHISSKVRRKKLLMLSVIIITKGQMLKMLKKILLEFSTPLTLYWLD